ncbi:MAG: hypothetical protein GDA50_02470 [Alphaproteobacteria bacterium GM202ARS2]|nr:hypothetical protein [Alphaproteobacteria bacterium GM202ARS2]
MGEMITWDWSFFSLEVPALVALAALIWQMKREQERSVDELKATFLERMDGLVHRIADVRVMMAETYVSKQDMRARDRWLAGRLEAMVSAYGGGNKQASQHKRRLGG